MSKQPDIFSFSDYRLFLKEAYGFLKETQASFSFRYFAKLAGFKSPNFLQLVMEGKRNLTSDSIPKFAQALSLNKQQTDYFSNLVLFNQAQDDEAKNLYYKKITHNRRYRELRQLENDQFQLYSHWYNLAIRELVTQKNFREDPVWIAQQLVPKISEKEAAEGLALLLKLKLLQRNPRGQLVQADPTLSSGAEVKSLAVANFHRAMLKKAAQAITIIPASERDISAVTIGVNRASLPQLKEKINQFRKELLATLGNSEIPAEQVYQLSIQLFPLTRHSAVKGKKQT